MYIYKTKLDGSNFLNNSEHPIAKSYIEQINSSCDKFRVKPITELPFSKFRLYEENGERPSYQKEYFERRRRLAMFTLRAWLWKEKADVSELEDVLFAVCNEYTWDIPAHLVGIMKGESIPTNKIDLFAAETAQSVAEALSLCGDLLHPLVVKRCIDEVFKRVIEPFESGESEKYGLWWENHPNNWAAVCGGCVGMAALYLIEDKERLRKITERTKKSCISFFNSCKDDGVCLEGVTYWTYATQYYVAFDELLYERLGERIPKDEDKMRRLSTFPALACLGEGVYINFSDCSDTHLFYGILCKLHERYKMPVPPSSYFKYIIDRCARTCGAIRSVAWFDPYLTEEKPLLTDVFLPDAQWAITRRADMTLAVKGGHNDEPHNHNDVGSYILVKGKDQLIVELGAEKYYKGYFSEKRYEYFSTGSHGHSLPIINGHRQCEGRDFAADKFEQSKNSVAISFKNAYPKEAELDSLVRNLTLDESSLTVVDSFKFRKSKNSVSERIITKLEVSIVDESHVSLSDDGKTLGAIEFMQRGKINLMNESYFVPNSSGKNDEYSTDETPTFFTIIEFESECQGDSTEISYKVY